MNTIAMKGNVNLKIVLGILAVIAVVLGVSAYFIIFGTGTNVIQPNTTATSSAESSSSAAIFIFPSSTVPSSLTAGNATSSAPSTPFGTFSSNFSAPYPVTWSEGQSQFAVAGASLTGNELTLLVNVTTGGLPQCVPINLRLISDEEGDMVAPTSPATTNFSLSTTTCEGTPNTIYPNEPLTFTVDPTNMPFLLVTGGTSNVYFEVATTTDGGLDVAIPEQSG
ncbi:MAG: hypothetical protein WCF77_00210 [Minisyncoccia bacterium]